MKKLTVRDVDVRGKRVLVRVDFNVPLEEDTRNVLDDTRIAAALPTIAYLRQRQARVILVSHLGRPGGKVVESARLAPVAARLGELLGSGVVCATDVIGESARKVVEAMRPGDVVMLENVRFEPGEEKNDAGLAKRLAAFADIFVNDAFGAAHRAHASTAGVAELLPAVAGFLMEKEIDYLSRVVSDPQPPVAAIIGGAKISSKISVLRHLLSKVSTVLIGGGMANTFLAARGCDVGASLIEEDQLETARSVLDAAARLGVVVGLPVDAVVAERFAEDAAHRTVAVDDVPAGWMILDAGPQTVADYARKLSGAKTVIWNGPLGVAEWEPFAGASRELARLLAALDATVIVGGGETVALVQQVGVAGQLAHVSTGGGASLEFLEGKDLPGVAALLDK